MDSPSKQTLMETSQSPLVNLPKLLPIAIKDYLERQNNKHVYRVIELRFALSRSEELTLDDTGKLLRITRERVRQIQVFALKKLRKDIFTIPLVELIFPLDLLREIKALFLFLSQQGDYLEEAAIFNLIEKRYSEELHEKEKSHLRLLFVIFDYERITIPDCRPFWCIGTYTFAVSELEKLSRALSNTLDETIISISFIDLLLKIKTPDRKKITKRGNYKIPPRCKRRC